MIRALLQDWIVGDGEMDVPDVGDRIAVGLGLGVEAPAGTPDECDANGIVVLGSPVSSRRSADARVVGALRLVWSRGTAPYAWLVEPCPQVHLLVMGHPPPRGVPDGGRVTVDGTVVIEPYLWGRDGLLLADGRFSLLDARVTAVETLGPAPSASGGGPAATDVIIDLLPVTP